MAGTDFTIDIPVNADGAAPAAAQLAALADRLTFAKGAAAQTSEAVKAGEAAYRGAEAAAASAAKALEKVNVAAEAQRVKLKAAAEANDAGAYARAFDALMKLEKAHVAAATKADQAKTALAGEAASLDRLKAAAAGAASNQTQLAKAADQTQKLALAQKKATDAAGGSGKVNEMAEAFGKLGGPLGSVGQKAFGAVEGLNKLSGSMGAMIGVTAGVVIAVVAVTAGIIAATAAILKFAITSSDAARSAALLSAGITGSTAAGTALEAKIHALGAQVPQTADELRNMAGELAKTGLQGKALEDALEDAAVKAATLKYGPDFAKQTLSLTNQAARLRDNISGPRGIFSGLNLEGFLGGLSRVVALFDSTSETGRAIKVVFESIFQPIVDGLASLAPKIVATFIQFEIWALRALIAIKPFGSTIVTVAKVVGVAVLAIGAVLAVAAGVILGMAAAAGALVVGLGYVGAKFTELIVGAVQLGASLIASPGAAFEWLKAKVGEVVAFLQGISLAEIGSALINGLVEGIKSGGAAVLSAITGIAGSAIDGAKKALGIASPSKVFAEIGLQTAAGMAGGVDSGSGDVQASMTDMVAPPAASPGAAPAGKAGGNTYIIQIHAPNGDAPSLVAEAKRALLAILEGDAAQLGAVEVAT